MKTIIPTTKINTSILFSFVIAVSLSSCSDDDSSKTRFDHTHDGEVTDLAKHKFEHEFAEQCVERELKTSVNKASDKLGLSKSCMCIATYMMKDLTSEEAEKFLNEKKNTQSLRIRFEHAAYQCLQQNSQNQPKAPVIFKQR